MIQTVSLEGQMAYPYTNAPTAPGGPPTDISVADPFGGVAVNEAFPIHIALRSTSFMSNPN